MNKLWVTELKAIDVVSGELIGYAGEHVIGETIEEAEQWCIKHKPYLKVIGRLVAEIPINNGVTDLDRMINYE